MTRVKVQSAQSPQGQYVQLKHIALGPLSRTSVSRGTCLSAVCELYLDHVQDTAAKSQVTE